MSGARLGFPASWVGAGRRGCRRGCGRGGQCGCRRGSVRLSVRLDVDFHVEFERGWSSLADAPVGDVAGGCVSAGPGFVDGLSAFARVGLAVGDAFVEASGVVGVSGEFDA